MKINIDNPTVSTASSAFIDAARGAQGWEGQNWEKTIVVPVTTLDALIEAHGSAFVREDRRGGIRGRGPGRADTAGGRAVVRVHHHPARRGARAASRAARRSGFSATMPRSARARRSGTGARPRTSGAGLESCRTRPIRETSMRAWREWAAAGFVLLAVTVAARAADALAVDVINESEPTLCAEKDNVYLKLQSGAARRFTVEAVHPAYAGTIVVDRFAPDFTKCDMSNDPVFKSERRQVTIFENAEWRLVGHTFDSFWRPNQVPVRVGNRVENGLHLLQLWTCAPWRLRRGAGALSRRRLLARAADAAREPALERVRLLVPDRAGRDPRPAARRHQGPGLRPRDQDLHAQLRARRKRDLACRNDQRRPHGAGREPVARAWARSGRLRRCARCS